MNTSASQSRREDEECETLQETAELVELSLAELRDCLCRVEDKKAYLQASFCAPHLIETESNPLWFLRVERFDANAAAQRLVNYWNERVLAFGVRAFLPLSDLSGKGALSPEDIRLHQTQLWTPLPNDSSGRPVMLFDLSRLCGTHNLLGTAPSSKRFFYYWAAKLSSNPKFHTSGVVEVRCVNTTGFIGENLRRNIALVSQALPFKWHRIHLCCVPPPESRKLFTKTVIPVIVHAFEEALPGRAIVHVGTSKEDMMNRMSRLGLASGGVPAHLGGTWTYPRPDGVHGGTSKKSAQEDQVKDEERLVKRDAKRLKLCPDTAPSSISTEPRSGQARLMLQALLEAKRQKVGSMRQLLMTPAIQRQAVEHLTREPVTNEAAIPGEDTVTRKPPCASALTTRTTSDLEAELRRTAAMKRLLLAVRGKVGERTSLQTSQVLSGLPAPNRSRQRALGGRVAKILENHGIKKRT